MVAEDVKHALGIEEEHLGEYELFEVADAPSRDSREFRAYLEEMGITETREGEYLVATGMTRKRAIDRLCALTGNMMSELDVQTSAVCTRGNPYFTIPCGKFYIELID